MNKACMFCSRTFDMKKDKGRYFMNIDVVRIKPQPSPFVKTLMRSNERAMPALWLCDKCGSRMVEAIETKRVE